MNLLQIALTGLFIYVLLLGAVLMTAYLVRVIRQYIQEGKKKGNGKGT